MNRSVRVALLALLAALGLQSSAFLTASGSPPPAFLGGGWDAVRLGNHRAVVRVDAPGDAVRVTIDWRRRDADPASMDTVIVDARSGLAVKNVARIAIAREAGVFVFQPVTGPGDYYVYFMPNVMSGRTNYPTVTYPSPQSTADAEWLSAHHLAAGEIGRGDWTALPEARVVALQSIDDFSRFIDTERTGVAADKQKMLAGAASAPFLLFAEDRSAPIRMTDDLPDSWVTAGPQHAFDGHAMRGEFYAFQVGVYAVRAIQGIDVRISDFRTAGGAVIAASAARCFNVSGIDWTGRSFTRPIAVPAGTVQPLWMGIQVPLDAAAGEYSGTVTVSARGIPPSSVSVRLHVSTAVIPDSGDDEPWRHSRLRWLDSTLAQDDEVVAPYTPMTVAGHTVGVVGREVEIGDDGFPRAIRSRFTRAMTGIGSTAAEVLAAPLSLVVQEAGSPARPAGGQLTFSKQAPGAVAWGSRSHAGSLAIDTRAQMEDDGNLEFDVSVTAPRAADIDDIRLEVPIARRVAVYMMGMGYKGGRRASSYEWKWDATRNQDAIWIGDVNAGVQISLKDGKYVRPLNTNFYLSKPLVMPASWDNGGRGGCRFDERDSATFLATCYSGARHVEPGQTLHYNFRLLLTPFHPIDTADQFRTRYFHAYKPLADVIAAGANTINVHHATDINPYINYPFLRPAELKAYVDAAHARDLKVKIYYTVRELSNHAAELFALRSLGDEVLAEGPGGGYSWLQEHLGSNYIAGWFVPELKDAAVINSGVSRWHNYYVEGLNWLVKNVGIDGLYIDDVAFDRTTMKRVRKVLDRGRGRGVIDLHSANQFNVRDGYASSANLYLEHFPYLSRIWFGEYFDYNAPPDYWLVEMSGIPFGVMGEMLEGGGNPWRGMLFGMTSRLPWAGDPRPVWKAWDAFGIQDSRMIGWWVPDAPVRTSHPDVLATAYVKDGRTLVAIASWAPAAVDVTLAIDWPALGLDPGRATVTAPAIDAFQPALTLAPGQSVRVEPGRGWLFVIGSLN